jgi:hypothetical protein
MIKIGKVSEQTKSPKGVTGNDNLGGHLPV